MNEAIYNKSFNLFLKNTDEKKVIKEFIGKHIMLNKKTNFLDIGGGTGILTKHIANKVNNTVCIEPNKFFCANMVNSKKITIINKKWEDVECKDNFDFILAAYVVTYFPKKDISFLIEKMFNLLSPGGKMLILSIDSKKGSWRNIHTYFYKLIKKRHKSSDILLKQTLKSYNYSSHSFTTHISAKNVNEMFSILAFDFHKYSNHYSEHYDKLAHFLMKNAYNNKKIILEMVHNAYIINKV